MDQLRLETLSIGNVEGVLDEAMELTSIIQHRVSMQLHRPLRSPFAVTMLQRHRSLGLSQQANGTRMVRPLARGSATMGVLITSLPQRRPTAGSLVGEENALGRSFDHQKRMI